MPKQRLQLTNLDGEENYFFQRELEYIKNKTYDIDYPELRARALIPVSNEANTGAESITYRQFDRTGVADLIADYADDLPRADVLGKEFTRQVKSLGASYGYSIQEVRASALANRSLNAARAMAARRAMEEKLDSVAAIGDPIVGFEGMINSTVVPAGAAVTGTWGAATADQILGDMDEAVSSIIAATRNIEAPDTILLPPAEFALISQLRIPDTNMTVLRFFLENNPYIRNVDQWYRLDGAGAGGTQRMIAYRRSPDVLTLEIPQEIEFLDPQPENLEFKVPVHMRTAGTLIYRPLGMIYRDNL